MGAGFLRVLSAALLTAALAAGATGAAAQSDREDEAYTPLNRPVESSDLPPALLPLDLWRGLDAAAVEKFLASPDVPPRSPALHQLWRRLLLATADLPTGQGPGPDAGKAGGDLLRLRLEACLLAEQEWLQRNPPGGGGHGDHGQPQQPPTAGVQRPGSLV